MNYRVGDKVVTQNGFTATVLSQLSGDMWEVQCNSMRMKVHRDSLKPAPACTSDSHQNATHDDAWVTYVQHPLVPRSIDLHGLRVMEVERALATYLDAVLLCQYRRCKIIHGIGSGAVRREVLRVLNADPRVARWEYEISIHGSHGATLVFFR